VASEPRDKNSEQRQVVFYKSGSGYKLPPEKETVEYLLKRMEYANELPDGVGAEEVLQELQSENPERGNREDRTA
jgi:hypothetical protein